MTLKTDQCSICLDSPPYTQCPGRLCCCLIIGNETAAKAGVSGPRDQIAAREPQITKQGLTQFREELMRLLIHGGARDDQCAVFEAICEVKDEAEDALAAALKALAEAQQRIKGYQGSRDYAIDLLAQVLGVEADKVRAVEYYARLAVERLEEAQRDAGRYRFLRSEDTATNPKFYEFWHEFTVKLCREEKMDAAVDEAMKGKP